MDTDSLDEFNETWIEDLKRAIEMTRKQLAELREANERLRDILEYQKVLSGEITCH